MYTNFDREDKDAKNHAARKRAEFLSGSEPNSYHLHNQ